MPRSRNRNRPPKVVSSPARPTTPQPTTHHGPTAIFAQQTKVHHGPLPSPEVLHDYDRLVPGAAERIIAMAERQAAHRQELERASLTADTDARELQIEVERKRIGGISLNERLGQLAGWSIAAGCVFGALWALFHREGALVIGLFLSLPVVGLVNAVSQLGKKPH